MMRDKPRRKITLSADTTPQTEASVEDYVRASAEAHGQDPDAAAWAWREACKSNADPEGKTS